MKSSVTFVGALLGVSVLLNIVLLTRSRDPAPPPPRPSLASPAREAAPAEPSAARPAPAVFEPPAARPDVVALPPPPGLRSASGPARTSIKVDPSVEAVLDAQEKFGGFWKELDRVFKAKDRIESAKYFQTVVHATMDFLELPESQRTGFVQAAEAAVDRLARARQERDAARKVLPPKDKNDPASYARYQQQKDALDARYQGQSKAAVDLLGGQLGPDRARHAEFLSRSDNWLRNLIPRSTP